MTGAELPPEKISLTIDQPDLKISKGKKKRAGSSRGIETLLRSLYRTHLDLTNLADNKANMMITVNGLIVSILLAAGGSVVAVTKDYIYMLPILVLLTSGFVSMFFAVMSARPSTERCCDVKKVPLDFLRGQANVMYFLDNADLTTKEYVGVMKEIVKDRDQVYEEMFVHVHSMGLVLARKFGLLRTAYTVFIYGLGFCVITFIPVFNRYFAINPVTIVLPQSVSIPLIKYVFISYFLDRIYMINMFYPFIIYSSLLSRHYNLNLK